MPKVDITVTWLPGEWAHEKHSVKVGYRKDMWAYEIRRWRDGWTFSTRATHRSKLDAMKSARQLIDWTIRPKF